MNASDDALQSMVDPAEAPRGAGRGGRRPATSPSGCFSEGPVTKNEVIKGKGTGFKYLGFASVKYE